MILTLLFWGCDGGGTSNPVPYGGGSGSDDDGGNVGGGGGSVVSSDVMWIGIKDTTGGLGIGPFTGCEIDAITWDCDGEIGAASEITGDQRSGAEEISTDPGLGEPDGPCLDDLESCAAPLGLDGYLLFKTDVDSLDGCEITVYEHEDEDNNRFDIYKCTAPDFQDAKICRPAGQGVDGTNTFTF